MPRTSTPRTLTSAMPTAPLCLQVGGACDPRQAGRLGVSERRPRVSFGRGERLACERQGSTPRRDSECCYKDTDPLGGATQRGTGSEGEVVLPGEGLRWAWKVRPDSFLDLFKEVFLSCGR